MSRRFLSFQLAALVATATLSLSILSILPDPVVAHESCCEAAARRARESRRLHDAVLSKSVEACPWLFLGLLTAAALDALNLPIGSIISLLASDDDPEEPSSSKKARKKGGAMIARRLLESIRLTFLAALLGLITPLCSCGALPLAAGLRSAGADRRAVVAFLTAAQSAGLDSAAVTVGMLGLRVAAFRLVGSTVLAVAAGTAVGTGGSRNMEGGAATNEAGSDLVPPCCDAGKSEAVGDDMAGGVAEEKKDDDPCCVTDHAPPPMLKPEENSNEVKASNERELWPVTFIKSLVRTFDEVWVVLAFGIIVTACVEKLWTGQSLPLRPPVTPSPPPPGWDEEDDGPWDDGSSDDDGLLSAYLSFLPPWTIDLLVRTAVVAAALPLQLCEHGVVSFAAALERAGATPGTAHAFLLSAPATNAASLGMLLGDRRGGGGGPGAALRGAAGIAVSTVVLSYVADRPNVLGGGEDKIGDAVESMSLPGWFVDASVYGCGALLASSLAWRVGAIVSEIGRSWSGARVKHIKIE